MIVVWADDLAGAAEMGGMAWRHGLSAEVRTGGGLDLSVSSLPDSAEVVVLDIDTRSCAPEEAARRVYEAAARCRVGQVDAVYKKVDSVLRGPVAAELGALLDALPYERCLLVPANPGLGRVISDGQYLVNGVPLHETDFRLDPEYPATTADVLQRVGACGLDESIPLHLCSPGNSLPEQGVIVGEAVCAADLATWAVQGVRPGVLAAGASEFFGAYLSALGYAPAERTPATNPSGEARVLFVCGSTSASSRAFCRQSEARGVPVLRLPEALLQRPVGPPGVDALIGQWADRVVRALASCSRAVIAIDRPLCSDPGMPQVLGGYLAEAVARALEHCAVHGDPDGTVYGGVDRLLVEGGATAVAVVRRMGWTRLRVCREWATGVVSLKAAGQAAPLVSMKPGSYAWPDAILFERESKV